MFRPFDPVKVQLSLDQTDRQREKLVFKLVEPNVRLLNTDIRLDILFFFNFQIPGFSVPSVGSAVEEPMEVEVLEVKPQATVEKAPPTKRTRRSKR